LRCSGWANQRNGDVIAQQYAGSEAFHKAQIDKIGENWKAVRHNIAMVAVKRYLSNILTDYEKQRTYALFLGEFKPNSKDLSHALWNDDVFLPYEQSLSDITGEKERLFPLVTKNMKLIQPTGQLLTENNAFRDEKMIILGGELSLEEQAQEKKELVAVQLEPSAPTEESGEEKEDPEVQFMPSNINFLSNFRKMDKEFGL
jgi:hypothetical protein